MNAATIPYKMDNYRCTDITCTTLTYRQTYILSAVQLHDFSHYTNPYTTIYEAPPVGTRFALRYSGTLQPACIRTDMVTENTCALTQYLPDCAALSGDIIPNTYYIYKYGPQFYWLKVVENITINNFHSSTMTTVTSQTITTLTTTTGTQTLTTLTTTTGTQSTKTSTDTTTSATQTTTTETSTSVTNTSSTTTITDTNTLVTITSNTITQTILTNGYTSTTFTTTVQAVKQTTQNTDAEDEGSMLVIPIVASISAVVMLCFFSVLRNQPNVRPTSIIMGMEPRSNTVFHTNEGYLTPMPVSVYAKINEDEMEPTRPAVYDNMPVKILFDTKPFYDEATPMPMYDVGNMDFTSFDEDNIDPVYSTATSVDDDEIVYTTPVHVNPTVLNTPLRTRSEDTYVDIQHDF